MEHKKPRLDNQKGLVPDLVPAAPKLGYKKNLDLFGSIPPIQNCVELTETVKISPITPITQAGKVTEFVINGYDNYVYDMSSLRLNLKLGLLVNGQPVGPARRPKKPEPNDIWDACSLINNCGASIFGKISVWINGTEVFSSNSNHQYRSWIENYLAYSAENKFCVLRDTQGFIADSGSSNDIDENVGMYLRSKWTEKGKVLVLSARLSHECFNLQKVLPPGTEVRVRVERLNDSFCVIWDNNELPTAYQQQTPTYSVDMKAMQMEVVRYKLEQQAISYISSRLATQAARYYVKRIETRENFIPKNSLEWTFPNLFGVHQVPLRLFFGLCEVQAKNGTITTNPLNFEPWDLSEITVKVNERAVDTVKINNSERPIEPYIALLKTLDSFNKPSYLDLTLDSWAKGPFNLYGFNLSKDLTENSDPQIGALSLNLRFAKSTPEGLVCIVYGIFQGTLFIHKDTTVETYDTVVTVPARREKD